VEREDATLWTADNLAPSIYAITSVLIERNEETIVYLLMFVSFQSFQVCISTN
jgi:hypothetical protein